LIGSFYNRTDKIKKIVATNRDEPAGCHTNRVFPNILSIIRVIGRAGVTSLADIFLSSLFEIVGVFRCEAHR
jgi:hypothetical protein